MESADVCGHGFGEGERGRFFLAREVGGNTVLTQGAILYGMDNVVKSTVVAGMVGAALGGTSYLFLAPHEDKMQGLAQAFMPQAMPPEVTAFLPQAVIFLATPVTGALGFAVAFLIVGTSLTSRSTA